MAIRPIDGNELVRSLKNRRLHILMENENDGAAVFDDIVDWIRYTPTLAPSNEPLTLEQLREMDGDKIAIHYIGNCAGFYEDEIASYYGDQEQYIQRYNGMLRACDLPLKYYGTQWTATLYHRPPEEDEDT